MVGRKELQDFMKGVSALIPRVQNLAVYILEMLTASYQE
jgi:hypothetical protein